MKKNSWLAFTIVSLFLVLILTAVSKDGTPPVFTKQCEETSTYYSNVIASPYIPESLTFADEEVPLEIYWVRERLDRELINVVYQHSRTLQTLKRTPRFFPVIEEILKEEEIPDDFKYLCVAESNLENVISPAKATGYWQFLESTGKSYGLQINDEVDERYDLRKSTRAACQYLKNSKKNLGNWALAAAAYNMGEGNLKKAKVNQQTSDYWNMYLNEETSRYIYRILAYKVVFENPEKYGLKVKEEELYYPVPCDEITVNNSISELETFALEKGISYLELKMLNPWLRSTKLTVNNREYIVKIPKKSKNSHKELIKSKNSH